MAEWLTPPPIKHRQSDREARGSIPETGQLDSCVQLGHKKYNLAKYTSEVERKVLKGLDVQFDSSSRIGERSRQKITTNRNNATLILAYFHSASRPYCLSTLFERGSQFSDHTVVRTKSKSWSSPPGLMYQQQYNQVD